MQEVLKIEKRNPTGRRLIGVKRTRHHEYLNITKITKKQKVSQANSRSQPNKLNSEIPSKKRKTLSHEEEILSKLLVYTDKIPEHEYENVLHQLGNEWDRRRVYGWWNYRNKKSINQ